MSFDSKCFDLAVHFLLDEIGATDPRYDRLADHLSREIQRTIETFIEMDVNDPTSERAEATRLLAERDRALAARIVSDRWHGYNVDLPCGCRSEFFRDCDAGGTFGARRWTKNCEQHLTATEVLK